MLQFLVDNIFVVFVGRHLVFQWVQTVPSSHRHLSVFIRGGIHTVFALNGKKTVSISVQSDLQVHRWYIVHNNPEFENSLAGCIYPAEIEIKDTTDSITSASYLDLLLSIRRDGQLHTSIYNKRDDLNFHIIANFPFLSSNIPSSPAYDGFISQLIRYVRACSSYEWGFLTAMRLSSNRDTSSNAWNRHLGSFMVDTGILLSNMKSPSHKC